MIQKLSMRLKFKRKILREKFVCKRLSKLKKPYKKRFRAQNHQMQNNFLNIISEDEDRLYINKNTEFGAGSDFAKGEIHIAEIRPRKSKINFDCAILPPIKLEKIILPHVKENANQNLKHDAIMSFNEDFLLNSNPINQTPIMKFGVKKNEENSQKQKSNFFIGFPQIANEKEEMMNEYFGLQLIEKKEKTSLDLQTLTNMKNHILFRAGLSNTVLTFNQNQVGKLGEDKL